MDIITLVARASSIAPPPSSTSSEPPFFPDPSTLVRPTQTLQSQGKQELTKSILEWLFLVIALILITTILTCRSFQLRRQNRSLKEFFSLSQPSSSLPATGRPRRVPRTTGLPTLHDPYRPISLTHAMLYPPPTPLPSVYHSNWRRTHAADTDAGGRRAGGPEDDHKDALPAYDNVGGPPKYMELDMDAATRQLHLDLAGVVEREHGGDNFDDGQDTPRQSAEETAPSSRSHLIRHPSEDFEQSHRQSDPDPDTSAAPNHAV